MIVISSQNEPKVIVRVVDRTWRAKIAQGDGVVDQTMV